MPIFLFAKKLASARGRSGIFGAVLRVASVVILSWLCCGGCSRDVGSAARAPTPVKSSTTSTKTSYKLVGVVREVDKKAGLVTIKHEEIAGFMDAMTMPFEVKRRTLLDEVEVGDEVEGTLVVERVDGRVRDFDLTELYVTRPAPPPMKRFAVINGKATLTTVPKVLEIGDEVPDFAFTGQDGKPSRLSSLRGRVVALTFIYTRCPLPNFCPFMDRQFADLASALAATGDRAEHVRLLSISFDPEHDTPDVLSKHASMRGAKPPLWTFAVATHDELAKVAPQLGLVYGPAQNEVIHNLSTAVIDERGRLVRLETGTERNRWTTASMLATIRSVIEKSRKK
ncbi:MAG: SCO family protein [Planctomycetota bacterium]|nr:SCO family protein [Planctomycetota bacterium]